MITLIAKYSIISKYIRLNDSFTTPIKVSALVYLAILISTMTFCLFIAAYANETEKFQLQGHREFLPVNR